MRANSYLEQLIKGLTYNNQRTYLDSLLRRSPMDANYYACKRKKDLFKRLVEKLDQADSRTLLKHLCSHSESSELLYYIRELINDRTRITVNDTDLLGDEQMTLLMWAAGKMQAGLTEWLLDNGADVQPLSSNGRNALMYAVDQWPGHFQAKMSKIITQIVVRVKNINQTDDCGNSALMLAAKNGLLNIFNILIANKAINVHLLNKDGHNALSLAVWKVAKIVHTSSPEKAVVLTPPRDNPDVTEIITMLTLRQCCFPALGSVLYEKKEEEVEEILSLADTAQVDKVYEQILVYFVRKQRFHFNCTDTIKRLILENIRANIKPCLQYQSDIICFENPTQQLSLNHSNQGSPPRQIEKQALDDLPRPSCSRA